MKDRLPRQAVAKIYMWMMFQLSLKHKKLEQIIIAQQIVFEK